MRRHRWCSHQAVHDGRIRSDFDRGVVGVGERPGKRDTPPVGHEVVEAGYLKSRFRSYAREKSKKITQNQQQKERSENLPGKERIMVGRA